MTAAGGASLRAAAVGAIAAVLLLSGCQRREGEGWDWERMKVQRRADPFGANSTFADGKVMQTPPAGTVPFDALVGEPALTEGVVGGVPVADSPLPATAALVAAGSERYGIFCSPCHGDDADGRGQVGLNMYPVQPPPLRSAAVAAMPAGALYRIIVEGRGRMPSLASQLDVRDRWAVVGYLRSLQEGQRRPEAAAADTLAAAGGASGGSPTVGRADGPPTPSAPVRPASAAPVEPIGRVP